MGLGHTEGLGSAALLAPEPIENFLNRGGSPATGMRLVVSECPFCLCTKTDQRLHGSMANRCLGLSQKGHESLKGLATP